MRQSRSLRRLEEDGISDILVIIFMFILLVIVAVLLHGFSNLELQDASRRQNELKANHFREVFSNAVVENYAISGLKAAAEQLILKDPTVANEYLHRWFDNVINDLCPKGFGVEIILTLDNNRWRHITPNVPKARVFVSKGSFSVTKVGGEIATASVSVRYFERG